MLLPAVCDNCGAFFTPRAINAENVRGLTISNVSVGPCPNCGGMGHIPDGVYNVFGNVLQVLSAPAHSIDELRRLAEILRQARARSESADAVKERIRKESPSLSTIADLLPANRVERIAFIAMVIAAVGVIGDLLRTGEKPTNVTVNQVINNITIETYKDPAVKKAQPAKPAPKKSSPRDSQYRKEKRRLKKSDRQRRRR
jgi:hypothetical protein